MKYIYKTKGGVCSKSIKFEIDDGIISNVSFVGGCHGNTQGLQILVKGMKAEEVIKKLKNIKCGLKKSSCPDQLATALEEVLKKSPEA
jgi:uncharacterized protein (TIGR03905 family)